MEKRYYQKFGVIMLLLFVLPMAGCINNHRANTQTQVTKFPEITKNADITKLPEVTKILEITKAPEITLKPSESDLIEEQIGLMTLEEKIGQMVIVGLEGYTVDNQTRALMEDYHVGGFILFGRNVEDSKQLLGLLNDLKLTNSNNGIPLFLSVDEEGGRVSRMPKELDKLPTNEAIGNVNNSDYSYELGRVIAKEIRAFGYNMNFAPVLDINSNPDNPVIGDRSFGSDADIVSKLGVQTMNGMRDNGVISVVKHFPGHGDTLVDSHISLPFVDNSMEHLSSFELIPFQSAILNQADAVMIAHILLNKIDAQNPASLSKVIITDLLREKMEFQGVVITDDITMGAIIKNYDIRDAAIKAVDAGCDIVLACHGYEDEIKVINAIKQAVLDGIISEERVDESVYRILQLKNRYNLTDKMITSINIDSINQEIKRVLKNYN